MIQWHQHIATFLAVLLCLGTFQPLAGHADTSTLVIGSTKDIEYLRGEKVLRYSDRGLLKGAENAFRNWRRNRGAFGAFYMAPDGNTVVGTGAHLDLDEAKIVARINCNAISRQKCELLATKEPRRSYGHLALPPKYKSDFSEMLRITESRRFIVIAAAPIGRYALAGNAQTVEEAEEVILRLCREDVKSFQQDRSQIQIAALKRRDLLDCRIIRAFQKP